MWEKKSQTYRYRQTDWMMKKRPQIWKRPRDACEGVMGGKRGMWCKYNFKQIIIKMTGLKFHEFPISPLAFKQIISIYDNSFSTFSWLSSLCSSKYTSKQRSSFLLIFSFIFCAWVFCRHVCLIHHMQALPVTAELDFLTVVNYVGARRGTQALWKSSQCS